MLLALLPLSPLPTLAEQVVLPGFRDQWTSGSSLGELVSGSPLTALRHLECLLLACVKNSRSRGTTEFSFEAGSFRRTPKPMTPRVLFITADHLPIDELVLTHNHTTAGSQACHEAA